MLAAEIPTSDDILFRLSAGWRGSPIVAVKDCSGKVLVYRALTPAALPFDHSVPGRLVEEPLRSLGGDEATPPREQ